MSDPRRLDRLLDGFADRVPGVYHAIVVSGDGLLVAASRGVAPERAEHLSAMVAGVVSLTQTIAGALGTGPVLRSVVQMRRSMLFVVSVGEVDSLASLAGVTVSGCDVGLVAAEMADLAQRISVALAPGTPTAP